MTLDDVKGKGLGVGEVSVENLYTHYHIPSTVKLRHALQMLPDSSAEIHDALGFKDYRQQAKYLALLKQVSLIVEERDKWKALYMSEKKVAESERKTAECERATAKLQRETKEVLIDCLKYRPDVEAVIKRLGELNLA